MRKRPELPPGYDDWSTQIKKYCPADLPRLLGMNPRHKKGFVFCHRGLYDRTLRIPENSSEVIENGMKDVFLLHELDVRVGDDPTNMFLAHDEVSSRVTSKSGRWSSRDITSILKTRLVIRRFDIRKPDFASSYQKTRKGVPRVEDLLRERMDWDIDKYVGDGRCLQLDLRGNDLPRAIVRFGREHPHIHKIILKGYNLDFTCCEDLETATASVAANQGRKFAWVGFPFSQYIMMVFYSKPLIALALQAKGMDPDKVTLEDRSKLDSQDFYDVTMKQVSSFIGVPNLNFIPEIVHSGLGLGYNKQTGKAINPLDGTPITDPEVVFESRVDRAMIEVSLELRKNHPELRFSSCTRLCKVRTSEMELVADIKTGKLKPKLEGEKGLSTKLRSIHGGLFPQSDFVVADDPYAEIAARTWTDEAAQLDRGKLLEKPYDAWLAHAREEVVTAVNNLNGPFLPNTWKGPLDDSSDIEEELSVLTTQYHSFITGIAYDKRGSRVYLDQIGYKYVLDPDWRKLIWPSYVDNDLFD
jgi:hypothetical protein